MKKILTMSFLLVLFVGVGFALQQANAAELIEMKASCFLPKNHPLTIGIYKWIDSVNEQMKDQVKVKYVGGPEVVPPFEQINAVKKGVIDVSFAAGPHYASQLPVMYSMSLSRIMPWEERETGFYDLIAKEHQKLGSAYLGRWLYGPFYMWLKNPVKTPDELKGVRLRTNPLYDRFYAGLGVKGVTINPEEAYTALERGVVEGTSWPIMGPREQGWIRHLHYIVIHPFYNANNCPILINLKTWNKLSDEQKNKMKKITADVEREVVAYWKDAIQKEYDLVMQAGVKPIEFSPSDAKRFVNLAYEVEWKELSKKIPDRVPQLKKLSGN